MASQDSASTPAIAALIAADVSYTVHTFDHDSASELSYGEEAAEALRAAPERVFKTLCVRVDGDLTMAMVPVAGSLDLKAVARALHGKKAIMAEPEDAERTTGYVLGGISPIGGRKKLPAVLDSSAFDFDQIYVSGGRRGLDIELTPADLVSMTDAATAPIAKDA